MININEVQLANLWGVIKEVKIKLDKNFTVLTGHNGCGKTTVLELIHDTLSFFHDVGGNSSAKNWASQFSFDNGLISRVYSLDDVFDMSDQTRNKIQNAAVQNIKSSLYTSVESIFSIVYDLERKNTDVSLSVLKEGASKMEPISYVFGMTHKEDDSIDDDVTKLPYSIFFKNDEFFYNEENEINEELEKRNVFIKGNNIDKTLYRLLSEFVLKEANSKKIKPSIEKNPSKLASEVKSKVEEYRDQKKRVDKEFLEYLESYLVAVNESLIHENWGVVLFDELGKFFSLTKRSVFRDNEGFIGVRLDSGHEVKWFNLSRGEKTLLSILLSVYLNKDKNVLFILDEPDLSLHIEWQGLLLPCLANLAPRSKFILSTHSPALIGNVKERFYNMASMMGF